VTTGGEAEEALGTLGREEAARSAAFLREALPGPLRPAFGEAFIRSHILYGEFVCRLVLGIARESGMATALGAPGDAAEIAARAGLEAPQARVPIDWMLRFLAARGWVAEVPGGANRRYRSRGELAAARRVAGAAGAAALGPVVDAGVCARGDSRARLPGLSAAARWRARTCCSLRAGSGSGSTTSRTTMASTPSTTASVPSPVADWLPGPGSSILELGGGLASGALALLAELEARDRLRDVGGYRFTEPVSAFLRRGSRRCAIGTPHWQA
jgi:hypothetical protein